jgi:type II secretory pathway predicted ATPase ExeA
MSYLQHFGLKHDPLGKNIQQTVNSTQQSQLTQKLNWLLQTKGVGLITGEAGTGKTTALRTWANALNPMTHHVIYQSDNHFKSFDIYSQLADQLGLDKYARYSTLWRALKKELLNLIDNKQLSPIWIIDEAHNAPTNFLTELPAFLNFSFDSREIMTIILVGLPQLQANLKKSIHSALHSRTLFQLTWMAIDDSAQFKEVLTQAFKNAGIQETIMSQSGMQLLYVASKGRLRYAHRILIAALQIAADNRCNHLPDDVIQKAIDDLMV